MIDIELAQRVVTGLQEARTAGMEPALVFDRVSTREQEKTGYSLDFQRESATAYAERKNLHVVHYFTVAESARHSDERKIFKVLLETAEKFEIKHLIFLNADRMCRNYHDLVKIENLYEKCGVNIHFYQDNTILNAKSGHNDKFIFGIKVAVAKQRSDEISTHSKNTYAYKIARGVAPGSRYDGYRFDRGERKWVIDDTRSGTIRMIFDLYDNNTMSLQDVADHMNAHGYVSSNGNRFSTSTLHGILSSPFYTGKFVYQGELHQGSHGPYIDEHRFQARLQRMGVKFHGERKRVQDYAMANFLRHEGYVLTGDAKTGAHNSGYYVYYINKAAGMRIREDRIMEQVDEIISGIQYSADFGELLKRLFREAVTKNDRTKSFDENVLKRKIVVLESKKKKLLGLFLDDDFDQKLLKETMNDLTKQIEFLEKNLQVSRKDKDAFVFHVADIIDAVRNFPVVFLNERSVEKKVKLLRNIADHVHIGDDGGVSIAWKREFSYILDEAILRLSDAPSRVRKCTVMHPFRDILPTLSDHINRQAPAWLMQFIAA